MSNKSNPKSPKIASNKIKPKDGRNQLSPTPPLSYENVNKSKKNI